MREYELMFIIKPDATEEDATALKERLKKIMADGGGEVTEELPGWGKKRLAYRIEKYTEGVYSVWRFNGLPDTVKELDRVMKISDVLLRHMIVRMDEQ